MNALWRPASIVTALVALVAVILPLPIQAKWPIVALAGLGWIASLALASMSQMRNQESPHPAELSPDSRILIRPIVQLRDELLQIVSQNLDMPAIKVIGTEALQEADGIVKHATSLVTLRAQLKKTLRGKSEAEIEQGRLKAKLENVSSEAERSALEAAIEATRQQASHYAQVEEAIAQVDGKLTEAQAALAELKARLAVGAAGARTETMDQEELTGMVGRLKSLSQSFDEAESTLQEHVR